MLTREQFETTYGAVSDAAFPWIVESQKSTAALQEQVVTLLARIKVLEDRLNKESHNSNNPLSSDGFKKKPVTLRFKLTIYSDTTICQRR